MKTYVKPEAELNELKFTEEIMGGDIYSGEWGVGDGENIPD